MGASNALGVYQVYGAVLGDQAMRVLTYMALVARDNDAEPWFALGHEALAELALGRHLNGDQKDRDAALRAVRRAVSELRRAGAITTAKRPTNRGGHARYRLWLHGPSPDGKRPATPVDNRASKAVDNRSSPDGKRPVTGPVVGRKMVGRRTKNVLVVGRKTSYPIERRNEEEEERRIPNSSPSTASCGKHPRDPPMSLPA